MKNVPGTMYTQRETCPGTAGVVLSHRTLGNDTSQCPQPGQASGRTSVPWWEGPAVPVGASSPPPWTKQGLQNSRTAVTSCHRRFGWKLLVSSRPAGLASRNWTAGQVVLRGDKEFAFPKEINVRAFPAGRCTPSLVFPVAQAIYYRHKYWLFFSEED